MASLISWNAIFISLNHNNIIIKHKQLFSINYCCFVPCWLLYKAQGSYYGRLFGSFHEKLVGPTTDFGLLLFVPSIKRISSPDHQPSYLVFSVWLHIFNCIPFSYKLVVSQSTNDPRCIMFQATHHINAQRPTSTWKHIHAQRPTSTWKGFCSNIKLEDGDSKRIMYLCRIAHHKPYSCLT
jgi:hypothetical protein